MAAAAAALPPICTDRPTKANATCTVPKGALQVESGLATWSITKTGGLRTEMLSVGSTVVKVGLSDRSDLQLGLTPLVRLRQRSGGERTRRSGFGDLVVRYKHRLTGDDAPVAVGVIPFVKLPTARRGLGNRKVEGGLAVPVSMAAGKATVTFGPELDLLADADGRGYHLALVNLVNIAAPIAPRITLAGELWSNVNADPGGTLKQASADAALAIALSDRLQLDAGVNLGLTRDTPDTEFYAGLSTRF